METWDVNSIDAEPHKPEILSSDSAARVIALVLPAGERLQEHEVHEQAFLTVIDGRIEVESGGQTVAGGPGFVAHFDEHERREVRAVEDARLLLVLAPWPGDGHPGAMSLADKATARERARERAA
jgi:quercetin dioxygenase-like cupin family protein